MGKNGSAREVCGSCGEGWTSSVEFGELREQDEEFGWIREDAEYGGVKPACFGFCATSVDDITKINFRFSRRHPWRGSVHTYRPHKWGRASLAPNPFPLTKSRMRGEKHEY